MWFGVSLLYRGEVLDRPPDEWLWEESIVIVSAAEAAEARAIAESIGRKSEVGYVTATGESLHWVFDRIERDYEIDADHLESGTEVFSRFLRASEVLSILTPFD